MYLGTRTLFRAISVSFSIAMALLVIIGSLVMMFGNFELGVILFVLGLVLIISNESIMPNLKPQTSEYVINNPNNTLLEEVADLAAIGYGPPILLAAYIFIGASTDFKLILFTALSFIVVTMKLFAKIATAKLRVHNNPNEVYSYPDASDDNFSEPGI